jgi:hypothetical protein
MSKPDKLRMLDCVSIFKRRSPNAKRQNAGCASNANNKALAPKETRGPPRSRSHLMRCRTSASMSKPGIIQARPVARGGRAFVGCILWGYGCTWRGADQALGDCIARGAVVVEVFPVELVHNWVQQYSLLVDCHHRIGRHRDPVVYIRVSI